MLFKRQLSVLIILAAAAHAVSFHKTTGLEKRIDALLSAMTLEEKAGQLVQYSHPDLRNAEDRIREGRIGSLLNIPADAEKANRLQAVAVKESRLGIPILFGFDVIHGFRTVFPIPLAESCTWDTEMAEQNARIAAREAAACGVRWSFAPMVDVARDPRWGRIAEGAGEDPFLGAAFASARVKGFQGDSLSHPESVAACAKHFVAYGGAEGGRDYNTVDCSELTLRNCYLPPFRAAVDAGAATLMSAFNDLNGVPASANAFTLTTILRQEWGFEGFVVSDWNSIGELIPHGAAALPEEAGLLAIRAGVDMDMEGGVYDRHLAGLVRSGKLDSALVDLAVRRILRVKFALGLFDNPYTDPSLARSILSQSHLNQALESARRSIVLLKNEKDLLPLNKKASIAVVGPLADNRRGMLGSWSGRGSEKETVSVLEGIREKLGNSAAVYAKGCDVRGVSRDGFEEAMRAAGQADVVIAVLGESADMSGEAGSRSDLGLPGVQEDLLKALVETGTPVVLVLVNGRPLALPWAAEHVPAILETWQLGIQHGRAAADVLFGDANPSGKLTASFPRATGQVPIYYNHKNTGRPPRGQFRFGSTYIDCLPTPLFPFGFGLSYTAFAYAGLRLSAETILPSGSIEISAEVTNTGNRSGDEIVQLYMRDPAASVTRPVRELRGFQKIRLQPGETRTVQFTLGPNDLGLYNTRMEWVVEPGEFMVWIGQNSAEGLEGRFKVLE